MLLCLYGVCCFVFFFKQKTAYDMRISDWSSDVCSSDLAVAGGARPQGRCGGRDRTEEPPHWREGGNVPGSGVGEAGGVRQLPRVANRKSSPEGEGDRRSRWRGIPPSHTPPPPRGWSPSPFRGGRS